jgi:hypothetical protein
MSDDSDRPFRIDEAFRKEFAGQVLEIDKGTIDHIETLLEGISQQTAYGDLMRTDWIRNRLDYLERFVKKAAAGDLAKENDLLHAEVKSLKGKLANAEDIINGHEKLRLIRESQGEMATVVTAPNWAALYVDGRLACECSRDTKEVLKALGVKCDTQKAKDTGIYPKAALSDLELW